MHHGSFEDIRQGKIRRHRRTNRCLRSLEWPDAESQEAKQAAGRRRNEE